MSYYYKVVYLIIAFRHIYFVKIKPLTVKFIYLF